MTGETPRGFLIRAASEPFEFLLAIDLEQYFERSMFES